MAECVVAIDVGGTNIKGAVIDRSGRAVAVLRRPTGTREVVDAVVGMARELVSESPVAAGIAVPGLVDERAGTVVNAANLGWRDVPIRSIMCERLAIPVTVSHDVRAGALAEGLLGAARGCDDYLLVTLGTGIGAAVVLGGQPYTGAHGIGGELGHTAVQPRGPLCGCGQVGCLEALASASHISDRYVVMAGLGEAVGADRVAGLAARGDPIAAEIWSDAVEALAIAIANYVTLLDPELVVIGGGMAAAGDDLFGPLRDRLAAHMRFGDPPPVVAAALGEDAGRHGAAIAAWRAVGMEESELASWEV